MDTSVAIGNVVEQQADAIVVNLFEGVLEPGGATGAVDQALDGGIRNLIAGGDFEGKLKQRAVLYGSQAVTAPRVILIGLGKQEDFNLDRAREAASVAAKYAEELGVKHLATIVHGGGIGGLDTGEAAQAVTEGSILGTYRFSVYQTAGGENSGLERLTVVEFDAQKQNDVEQGVHTGQLVGEGVCFARDLANHPGNVLPPSALAERAKEMAEEVGLVCEILDENGIDAEGMRTIQAVAQGSTQPPRLIVLKHEGGKPNDQPVVLVGKGITFDSGGISLKNRDGMWNMKFDMCGAAGVIGAMQAIARLDLPVHTIGVVAAAENMPGGNALRPGDIIKSMLGKTIEIRSTDAEGRLVLADAVAYSARFKPVRVIDMATLTGSCNTALGNEACGLVANDDSLADEVARAGERAGEIAWRLPLFDGYREAMKSEVADLKNSGSSGAGVSTGAAFIEAFVQDFPWAHLDIASTAWSSPRSYASKGATGFGVRLLVDYVRNRN